MYKYRVTYIIIEEQFQKYITVDETIEDYEILEEIIIEKLVDTFAYYGEGEYDIYITNIEPMERGYINKELNNCTEDNKLC